VFTGDVFQNVSLALPGATTKPRTLIVLTHPCSMRQDGVALRKRLLVAVVKQRTVTSDGWPVDGLFDLMPLPNLDAAGGEFVAEFDNVAIVESSLLVTQRNVASVRGDRPHRGLGDLCVGEGRGPNRVRTSLSRVAPRSGRQFFAPGDAP
jgi:hypothetical protein